MNAPDFENAMRLAREPTKENLVGLMQMLETLEFDYAARDLDLRVPPEVPGEAGGAPPVPSAAREAYGNFLMSYGWIYSALLLAYLAQGDLDNARFLTKRVPGQIKATNAELGAATHLLKLLWNREREQFYASAAQPTWSEHLAPLVGLLVRMSRDRTIALLVKAYSSIKAESAGKLLGIEDQAALTAELQAGGWQLAPDGFFVPPVQPSGAEVNGLDATKASELAASWGRVQELAKIVVNLELQ